MFPTKLGVILLTLPVISSLFTGKSSPNSAQAADNQWSIRIGDFDLFNIPKFNIPLIDSGIESIRSIRQGYRDFDIRQWPLTIDPSVLEDAFLKTPQLLRKYGYPAEVHHVRTKDGYILELHRIARGGAMPVLLTHGLLDSSATWIIMGPDKGLGYLLYDQGYDVWMLNVRGNTYSRNHTRLQPRQKEFWDFTFHEMGRFDLPAAIDYVLRVTKRQQLHYIGHSQGTAVFWIMCSERPEYSQKILLMQALAPVAFIKHAKSPVVDFLAFFQEPLGIMLRLIGANEFLPSNEFLTMFKHLICDDDTITEAICTNVVFVITGFDKQQMNETMLPVILGHAPAGASTRQMQHYGQLKRSGHFSQYDYGWLKNHWRYHSSTPPAYKLKNVRCKVALHYSENDWLSTPEDVAELHRQLPNVLVKMLVDYPEFNHVDFVWGINARQLLYRRVLKLMAMVDSGDF